MTVRRTGGRHGSSVAGKGKGGEGIEFSEGPVGVVSAGGAGEACALAGPVVVVDGAGSLGGRSWVCGGVKAW